MEFFKSKECQDEQVEHWPKPVKIVFPRTKLTHIGRDYIVLSYNGYKHKMKLNDEFSHDFTIYPDNSRP